MGLAPTASSEDVCLAYQKLMLLHGGTESTDPVVSKIRQAYQALYHKSGQAELALAVVLQNNSRPY